MPIAPTAARTGWGGGSEPTELTDFPRLVLRYTSGGHAGSCAIPVLQPSPCDPFLARPGGSAAGSGKVIHGERPAWTRLRDPEASVSAKRTDLHRPGVGAAAPEGDRRAGGGPAPGNEQEPGAGVPGGARGRGTPTPPRARCFAKAGRGRGAASPTAPWNGWGKPRRRSRRRGRRRRARSPSGTSPASACPRVLDAAAGPAPAPARRGDAGHAGVRGAGVRGLGGRPEVQACAGYRRPPAALSPSLRSRGHIQQPPQRDRVRRREVGQERAGGDRRVAGEGGRARGVGPHRQPALGGSPHEGVRLGLARRAGSAGG